MYKKRFFVLVFFLVTACGSTPTIPPGPNPSPSTTENSFHSARELADLLGGWKHMNITNAFDQNSSSSPSPCYWVLVAPYFHDTVVLKKGWEIWYTDIPFVLIPEKIEKDREEEAREMVVCPPGYQLKFPIY